MEIFLIFYAVLTLFVFLSSQFKHNCYFAHGKSPWSKQLRNTLDIYTSIMPQSRSNIHWNASIPVTYTLECLCPGHLYIGMPLSRSLIHWNASIPVTYPLECLCPGHLYTGMPLSRSLIHWNASVPVTYTLECLYPGHLYTGMPLSRSLIHYSTLLL